MAVALYLLQLLEPMHFLDEPDDVGANIGWPRRDQVFQALVAFAVQRSRRVLEVRQIATHRPHEPGDAIAKSFGALCAGLALTSLVDEPAKCRRDAIRLILQPIPVPRQ